MANQKHLDILRQGVEVWNQWRKKHPKIAVDLRGGKLYFADLRQADMRKANLKKADLHNADLHNADLREANLSRAKLVGTHFKGAILTHSGFNYSTVNFAVFDNADLSEADFQGANLSGASLRGANLSGAILLGTNLDGANLNGADLSYANVGMTIFSNVDLRRVKGVDTLYHFAPSIIATSTLERSEGDIPEVFLRNAGLSNAFITYARSLSNSPIEYYTCFISHSSEDRAFAKHLYADLQNKGVRCWYAPEDLTIGAKIRPSIDESIRLYDKLLLVLSQHSVASQWVEQEVETALEKERKGNRTVLFPISLDNAVMEIEGGWPTLIRNTRNIGDFTLWKQHDNYQKAFERLLRDLKAEAVVGGK